MTYAKFHESPFQAGRRRDSNHRHIAIESPGEASDDNHHREARGETASTRHSHDINAEDRPTRKSLRFQLLEGQKG